MTEDKNKKNILFLCTHNSARSQIAMGLLRSLYSDRFVSYSAGSQPTFVDPDAIKVMQEIGLDISDQRSKSLDELKGIQFDLVVTLCDSAREACPYLPGAKKMVHQVFRDPAQAEGEERLSAFRKARDEILNWIVDYFGREILHDNGAEQAQKS